jgi:hypothetical protein
MAYITHGKRFKFKILLKIELSVYGAPVYVRNPYTWWKSVLFVHDVHQVFVVTISNFYHTLQVSNEDAMQSFIRFRTR